ncbi:VOC family protein [Myxococcota bacterium]|nr:VOC family protein [Myxococcota bacterium]
MNETKTPTTETTSGPAAAVARLEHAYLNVTDLDRTLAFYGKLLPGWGVRWSGTNRWGRRWVHFGAPVPQSPGATSAAPRELRQPSYLSLSEVPPAPAQQLDYDRPMLAIMHLGFTCDSVEALLARMHGLGEDPTDVVLDDPVFRRAYFVDPDGHELELVEAR